MADITSAVGGDSAVAFMVSAGLVYEIVAAACSSPQTTEINVGARSATLMKWVNLGLAQAGLFIVIGACLSDHPAAVIAGGALGATLMYGSYVHAQRSGLQSDAPPTETYG
jgi:hypothetical protein